MTTPLPHRFSERSVLRYLDALVQLSRAADTPTTFIIVRHELSAETVCCRFRDAVNAFLKGYVSHPLVNLDTLRRAWSLHKVTHNGSDVTISPKAQKTAADVLACVTAGESGPLAVVPADDATALSAFALLLGRRLLTGQVHLLGTPSPTLVSELTSAHDISIFESAGVWLMI
jgi:hypothetical protein